MTARKLNGARVDGKQSTQIRISNKLKPRHSLKCLRSLFLAYFPKLLAFLVCLPLAQLRDGRKPLLIEWAQIVARVILQRKYFKAPEGSKERSKRFLGVRLPNGGTRRNLGW